LKAIRFVRPKLVEVVETDIPRISEDEVLCKVEMVGICGSDYKMWEGTHWLPESWPMQHLGGHGHETAASVVEVGARVEGIRVGDRVVGMDRSYAEYTKSVMIHSFHQKPGEQRLPIVCNELSFEEMPFADPLACAINCVIQSEAKKGGTVVILGQGPVGLLMTQLFVRKGVHVAATEVSEVRMALSKKFGATVYDAREGGIVDRILKDHGMVDCVIEAVGIQETLSQSIPLVKTGGKILIFGAQQMMEIPYKPLRMKGIEMRFPEATYDSQRKRVYWQDAVDVMRNKEIDVHSLITCRLNMWDLQSIFEGYDRENWIKVIVRTEAGGS
jgi:threonine dehydrogenase-like Zn-dependent dehydrogenase